MKIVKRESLVKEFEKVEELSQNDQELLAIAREVMENAYAPYSQFLVGCALRLENGVIVKGSNQENMAYPSGLCAERVAIFSAGAQFPGVAIVEMAVTARALNYPIKEPIMCCGACLQSISEYERRYDRPIRTLLHGENGPIWLAEEGSITFLPFQFDVPQLKK
ncbi:MAG: cytidine deaminase [Bacteroidia bacterium]|nr:cytidine deaminase [Bacteroidia bacterium]MCF8427329.1 cytidine deaminase [Bacteroidia bacterium]